MHGPRWSVHRNVGVTTSVRSVIAIVMNIARELRHAFRSLVHHGRISLAAVSLFAVTIGVCAAVYAVVDAVLLRPIGIRERDRTVVIWQRDEAHGTPVVEASYGEADLWRRGARSLETLGVFSSVNWPLTLVDGDSRTRLAYAAVSPSFFDVAGVGPSLGRVLDERDEAGNDPRTAVISHQLWRQRFGARPRVIGTILRVQEDVESPVRSVEVVGVMPPAFDFPFGAQLWMPAAPTLRALARRANQDPDGFLADLRVFYAVGRLRQDAAVPRAAEELSLVSRRSDLARAAGRPTSVVVTPVAAFLQGPSRPVLWTMLGGALLMVLLSCSSVAGRFTSTAF